MKRREKRQSAFGHQSAGIRTQTPDFRLPVSGLLIAVGLLATSALALTDTNPYTSIVSRNAFALKPPTPPPVVAPPVAPPAGIDLQGITSILGRPQVLLRIKMTARPPETAKDQSVVLDVGQREGEVEVVSIDWQAGVVKLKNRGEDLSLNMKDNAAKPEVGAVSPGTAALPGAAAAPMGTPGMIPPAGAAPSASFGGASVSTFGGAGSVPMPSRSLRGTPMTAPGTAAAAQTQRPRELSVEEGTVLLEVNRKLNEGKGLPYPPSRVNLDK